MSKKVSVIIPCYNGEKVIDRSIESVFIQDYDDVELIVVDDGSTDKSKDKINFWISQFEEKGFKLKYIYQENRGLGGAINTGLKYVTGEYLTLLDADDIYLQSSISKKAKYLDEHPDISVVRSNGWLVNGENRWLFVQTEEEKSKTDIFEDLLNGGTNNWAGSYMVRTSELFAFYTDRNIYPSPYGQNLQILLPLTYKKKVGFIDEPLMEYIKQENSLSSSKDSKAQLKKGLKNAEGYRDIRHHVLNSIAKDEEELVYYRKIIEQGYWHLVFINAVTHGEREILKESYRKMKKLDSLTLQSKIDYYSVVFPLYSYVLKALRKCRFIY